jgi:hypothetical protein
VRNIGSYPERYGYVKREINKKDRDARGREPQAKYETERNVKKGSSLNLTREGLSRWVESKDPCVQWKASDSKIWTV